MSQQPSNACRYSQRPHAEKAGACGEQVLMLTSLSQQWLRSRRMDRHQGMTVQSLALRSVVKQVDGEGPCCR